MTPESFAYHETAESVRDRKDPEWEPEWIRYIFSAWVQCDNEHCTEKGTMSGTGSVFSYFDYDSGDGGHDEEFKPLTCIPMPQIFSIPKNCPNAIAEQLRASFAIFWADPQASAGHVRVAIEFLMDHLRVPRSAVGKSGNSYELKLHDRIERFKEMDPINGPHLMALKWLGNAGAHTSTIDQENVLMAFEILEHTLAEIIERRSERIQSLATELHAKFAPRRS